MAHHAEAMTRMEDPTKWFTFGISRIQYSWNVAETDVTTLFPGLDAEGRGVNMASAFSGVAGVDDFDTGFVVFVDGGW